MGPLYTACYRPRVVAAAGGPPIDGARSPTDGFIIEPVGAAPSPAA